MKKTLIAATVLALAGMNVQTAKAGDREWATAGKILTGVIAGAVLASAIDSHASYSVSVGYGAPVYCPPPAPVVCALPRVVVAPVCAQRPVVVYRQPVYVQPAPVVAYDRGHRHGRSHGNHHGWGYSRCR